LFNEKSKKQETTEERGTAFFGLFLLVLMKIGESSVKFEDHQVFAEIFPSAYEEYRISARTVRKEDIYSWTCNALRAEHMVDFIMSHETTCIPWKPSLFLFQINFSSKSNAFPLLLSYHFGHLLYRGSQPYFGN
jgi:hypothetical protein